MLSKTKLRQTLGVPARRLDKWIAAGLPHRKDGRRLQFDAAAVALWLACHEQANLARRVAPGECAATREEAAELLGVAARTLAGWLTRDDFPGVAGPPGKREGYFPIDQIAAWREETFGRPADEEGPSPHRRYQLALARSAELALEKELGHLVDAEEVARFSERVVSSAKSILEPLPDQIAAALPAKTRRQTKAAVRERAAEIVEAALETLAELTRGDDDD